MPYQLNSVGSDEYYFLCLISVESEWYLIFTIDVEIYYTQMVLKGSTKTSELPVITLFITAGIWTKNAEKSSDSSQIDKYFSTMRKSQSKRFTDLAITTSNSKQTFGHCTFIEAKSTICRLSLNSEFYFKLSGTDKLQPCTVFSREYFTGIFTTSPKALFRE